MNNIYLFNKTTVNINILSFYIILPQPGANIKPHNMNSDNMYI